MAVGEIFNARLTVTGTAATLDTLAATGAQTYAHVRLRVTVGTVAMGNASVTQAVGFILPRYEDVILNSGSIIGLNLHLIGPGTVDFFGIASV